MESTDLERIRIVNNQNRQAAATYNTVEQNKKIVAKDKKSWQVKSYCYGKYKITAQVLKKLILFF